MKLTITCPRCGGRRCEWSPREMFCEDCLLQEYQPHYPWRDRDTDELLRLWDEELRRSDVALKPQPETEVLGEAIENISKKDDE